ncbi:GH25 family lysozyme [Aquibium microcysteis]|uniref:glycoside hydrolase family 25 protein n=1 Tax=Aquibium microcysteis TaxID=675281 RepID=UPI00165D00AD|nr:GH25 family lysozyme [Aquibium microcysteis]
MRRWAAATLAACAVAMLAGCTSGGIRLSDLAPTSGAAPGVAVTNPRYGDRDPHAWTGRAPWAYPVHGTDVSKYQGPVDWEKARASGISFAFIKATEGGDRVDEFFHRNWNAAKLAGVPRGAYHFFYFCRPAIEQAQWFIRHVPRDRTALPPVLDMEWNHLSPSCKLRPPAATVRAEMKVFLDAVEKHYGKRPIIYTSIDFWEDNGLSGFSGYDWWLRSVADHPDTRYGRQNFLFWQYTGTGIVPGIRGDADINVFSGSVSAWQRWLKATAG